MQDLDRLYHWADSDHANAASAGQILLSLWNGQKYQVNLQAMLMCDEELFHAARTVLAHLYVNKLQITDLIREEDIAKFIDRWGSYNSDS